MDGQLFALANVLMQINRWQGFDSRFWGARQDVLNNAQELGFQSNRKDVEQAEGNPVHAAHVKARPAGNVCSVEGSRHFCSL